MSDDETPLDIKGVKNLAMEMLGPVHANTFIFRAAVVMLAVIRVGIRPEAIAEFTGYSLRRRIIPHVLKRMQEVGILDMEKKALRVDWLGEYDSSEQKQENQIVAFVMDCMAIDGHFTRTEENGELYYKLTDKAERVVEELRA